METQAGNVLIADDHYDSAELLQQYLQHSGYEAFIAQDGEEALDRAHILDPVSIILDLELPKLNGFEVAAKLRREKRFTESLIIAYSGHGSEDYYRKAQNVGFDFYIVKPAEPELLIACIEPEKYPSIICSGIVVLSKQLRQRSIEVIAKGQALSQRSKTAVERAQKIAKSVKRIRN